MILRIFLHLENELLSLVDICRFEGSKEGANIDSHRDDEYRHSSTNKMIEPILGYQNEILGQSLNELCFFFWRHSTIDLSGAASIAQRSTF